VILSIHGVAGGWDELLIAVVAFAVLWIAVKLAGRKPADADEEDPVADEAPAKADAERNEPAPPPAAKSR
jgi:hypothetical protein